MKDEIFPDDVPPIDVSGIEIGFRERPDGCTLCGQEKSGLDFHHWMYEPVEIGCYICRACHEGLHWKDLNPKMDMSWVDFSYAYLAHEHLRQWPEEKDLESIRERYNIPKEQQYILRRSLNRALELGLYETESFLDWEGAIRG